MNWGEAALLSWTGDGWFGAWAHALIWGLSLLAAVAVTLHVLRSKREVGAAIGWIGLVWLSPVIGTLLYLLLGVNRVRRRARRLSSGRPWRSRAGTRVARRDLDGRLAPLAGAVARLTGRPLLGGNRFGRLENGDAAYPLMVAAIGAARRSVMLCSYIFRDDAAGAPVIDALIAAHDRGVEVRVLIDGIGGGYFRSPATARLHRHGVKVTQFMHSTVPWRMPFLNLRTHKKILVLDGVLAFSGGLNIGAENLVAGRPVKRGTPVADTHFRIEGPVVHQLAEAFAKDWSFVTGEELEGEAWFPDLPEVGESAARVITSGPDLDLEKIEFAAMQAVATAHSSVEIMTPYFLPDERVVTALAMAAIRGVAVDIVIPTESNHRLIDWATRAHIGPLLDAGCHFWLGPPPFNHSKLMVVDKAWSLVGSANWDVRSFRLNFEIDLEVYDEALAHELHEVMAPLRRTRLTREMLQGRSRAAQIRDAAVRLGLPYF